jgi:phenylacetate-CoA ligase
MLKNIKALYRVYHDLKLSESKKSHLVKRRLKTVLIESYKNVPYYRKLMDDIGYNPLKDYIGPEDLLKFPVTTKQDLKTTGESFFLRKDVDTANLFTDSTSGSTGIPLIIYRSWAERSFQVAKYLRVLFQNGYSLKDKIMSISSPARLDGNNTILQKIGLLRRLAVSYLLPIPKIVDILLKYKPQVLSCNRSHIDLIALELLKRKIQPKSLKLILVGAEMINDNNRNLYRQAFNLNAIECYASVEMGVMAYEIIGENGLYMNDDLTYFEFLDKNGNPVLPGTPGRVIVTDLIGKTMPIIRYDQGDFVITENAIGVNGKPEIRISKIIGRDDDHIILPDGNIRSFHDFYEIMDKFQGIIQFKIIQKTNSHFQIKIAAQNNYFNEIYNHIMASLYANFPGYCKFDLLRLDSIEPDPNGKLRMLVSELNNFNK